MVPHGPPVIGTGYQHALQREARVGAFQRTADERDTPFVEIDETITAYVPDGDATMIGSDGRTTRCGLIDDLKVQIMTYVDKNNPGAVRKAEHYLAALDAQQ